MCDCVSPYSLICLSEREKISRQLAECLGGCSCECHSAPIDAQAEAKNVIQEETQRVIVKFAEKPNMRRCPSCKMYFAGPEHSQHKRNQKVRRREPQTL